MNKEDLKVLAEEWFEGREWTPFQFQEECWEAFWDDRSGQLNAPTGSGKTYALWIPAVLEYLLDHEKHDVRPELRIIWVTPLRALAKDIHRAMVEFCEDIDLPWRVGLRTGDTPTSERQRQKKESPQALVITPESLHILLCQKDYPNYFKSVRGIIVDEWHEIIGTKRGVATELAISRLKTISQHTIKIWGISATIGNLKQAKRVLLGEDLYQQGVEISAEIDKKIALVCCTAQSLPCRSS